MKPDFNQVKRFHSVSNKSKQISKPQVAQRENQKTSFIQNKKQKGGSDDDYDIEMNPINRSKPAQPT